MGQLMDQWEGQGRRVVEMQLMKGLLAGSLEQMEQPMEQLEGNLVQMEQLMDL